MRYWHQQGRHQKVYSRLHDKLVPREGEAKTEAGEIIRVIGNVVYEVGNNGGYNFDSGRRDDLESFVSFLKEYKFEQAETLHKQLAGLAVERPDHHCGTCTCNDDEPDEPPALDEHLFDAVIDLLVMEAAKLDRRKPSITT